MTEDEEACEVGLNSTRTAITHVCQYWREAALATPELWSTITLAQAVRNPNERLRQDFQRAKTYPLRIDMEGYDENQGHPIWLEFVNLLVPRLQTVQRLEIRKLPTDLLVKLLLGIVEHGLPNLTHYTSVGLIYFLTSVRESTKTADDVSDDLLTEGVQKDGSEDGHQTHLEDGVSDGSDDEGEDEEEEKEVEHVVNFTERVLSSAQRIICLSLSSYDLGDELVLAPVSLQDLTLFHCRLSEIGISGFLNDLSFLVCLKRLDIRHSLPYGDIHRNSECSAAHTSVILPDLRTLIYDAVVDEHDAWVVSQFNLPQLRNLQLGGGPDTSHEERCEECPEKDKSERCFDELLLVIAKKGWPVETMDIGLPYSSHSFRALIQSCTRLRRLAVRLTADALAFGQAISVLDPSAKGERGPLDELLIEEFDEPTAFLEAVLADSPNAFTSIRRLYVPPFFRMPLPGTSRNDEKDRNDTVALECLANLFEMDEERPGWTYM